MFGNRRRQQLNKEQKKSKIENRKSQGKKKRTMSRVCVLVSRCGDCDWSQSGTSVLQRWEYPYTRVVGNFLFSCGATQGECDGNVNCDTCQRSGCRWSKEERRGIGDWTEWRTRWCWIIFAFSAIISQNRCELIRRYCCTVTWWPLEEGYAMWVLELLPAAGIVMIMRREGGVWLNVGRTRPAWSLKNRFFWDWIENRNDWRG